MHFKYISESYFKDVTIKNNRDKDSVMKEVSKIAIRERNNKKIKDLIDNPSYCWADEVGFDIKRRLQDSSFSQRDLVGIVLGRDKFIEDHPDIFLTLGRFLPGPQHRLSDYINLHLLDVDVKHNEHDGIVETNLIYSWPVGHFGNYELDYEFDESSALLQAFFVYCKKYNQYNESRDYFKSNLEMLSATRNDRNDDDFDLLVEILPKYNERRRSLGQIQINRDWFIRRFMEIYDIFHDNYIDIKAASKLWQLKDYINFIKVLVFNKLYIKQLKEDLDRLDKDLEEEHGVPFKTRIYLARDWNAKPNLMVD